MPLLLDRRLTMLVIGLWPAICCCSNKITQSCAMNFTQAL